ncbi:MAG: hypothetical protein GYB33_01680 [Gammaproteobacteria bacterium]|nr:hypothetical protein [Gammaproteobacteria bacterium]
MQSERTLFAAQMQSPLAVFAGIIGAGIALKFLLLHLDAADNLSLYIGLAIPVAAALAWVVPYQATDKPLRIIIAGTGLMLGLYALANYPSYPLEPGSHGYFFEKIRFLIPLFAALALWRPAFCLLPILYTAWRKKIDVVNTGFPLSQTDYMPVIEVSLLLVCGLLLIHFACRTITGLHEHRETLLQCLLMAAIGIHFGNYFHSGLAKLMLDGGPLSWVLYNHTYYLINVTMELGTMPLSRFPQLTQLLYDFFQQHYVAFNAITLVGQLVCVALVSSTRRIIAITLFYDAMHVAIFLVSGIFFWKWIALNALIVAAIACLKGRPVARAAYLTGTLFTLVGILFFFTARLAWYDTQTLRHVFVKAVDHNDHFYLVPTNYFLNASVTVSQGRLLNTYPGHFALTDAMGSTTSFKSMQLLNQCTPLLYPQEINTSYDQLTKLVHQTHQFVVARETDDSRFDYDLFPHHIWSNPLEYQPFRQLDKRTIDYYTIHTQSKCLRLQDGQALVATVHHSSSAMIPVQNHLSTHEQLSGQAQPSTYGQLVNDGRHSTVGTEP